MLCSKRTFLCSFLIFRHGVLKTTGQQVPPHTAKAECDRLAEQKLDIRVRKTLPGDTPVRWEFVRRCVWLHLILFSLRRARQFPHQRKDRGTRQCPQWSKKRSQLGQYMTREQTYRCDAVVVFQAVLLPLRSGALQWLFDLVFRVEVGSNEHTRSILGLSAHDNHWSVVAQSADSLCHKFFSKHRSR